MISKIKEWMLPGKLKICLKEERIWDFYRENLRLKWNENHSDR